MSHPLCDHVVMNHKTNANQVTEIAFILDRSGSMGGYTEAAIAGFNQFLRDQQEAEGIARLTLVQFDDRYEVPIDNIPVSEVVGLTTETYQPRGMTALVDAIGRTIKSFNKRIKALPKKQRPGKVIFAIFTDGLENASRKFTWQDIADRIRKRRDKDGWQFLFLGANQDAIATAAQMNIHAHDAATASYNDAGVRGSSRAISRKIRAIRDSDATADNMVNEDYSKSMSDLLKEEEADDSRRDDE